MTPQDRDSAVEHWLRQTPIAGAAADACLDAETLAAWTDGTLDAPMRSMAEAHAATCARCQEMLAVMVRTTPVVAASTGSPMRKWLMMLGPALAAATAVAIWVAVDHRSPQQAVIDTLAQNQAKQESPAATPLPQPVAPAEEDAKLRRDSPDRSREAFEAVAARPEPAREAAKDKADRREPSPTQPFGALTAGKPVDEERKLAEVPAPPAAAPMPAARPLPPQPAPSANARADAQQGQQQADGALTDQLSRQSQAQNQNAAANQAAQGQASVNQAPARPAPANAPREAVTVTAESPALDRLRAAPAAKTEAGRGGAASGLAGARVGNETAPTFDVVTGDATVRWRVIEGRLVQRSVDQGRTWSTNYTLDAGAGRITSGVCPTAAVCWLAGRSGLVLRTTDGQKWQRVPFPQDLELTAVTSTGERTATVVAADGRRFATADGGRTWAGQ
jgi:hypothetical protein